MKKLIEYLISKIKYIVIIYAAVQLILIVSADLNYNSDSLYYYNLAQECLEQGEFYPTQSHLYEDYLVAPLNINALVLILKINNSAATISVFNLILIFLEIFFLFKLTSKLFSAKTAQLTILLLIFYLNTPGLLLQNYTELFFLLIITLSIYLLSFQKIFYLILSGFTVGATIAVRPLGWALLAAIVLIQIYSSVKSKKLILNSFFIYLGTFLFILLFGGLIFLNFGKFEYTSTTGPVNLLIGANNDATGAFNSKVHEKGKAGFIDNPDSLTFEQKGEFYQQRAIYWIEEHPVKWVLLAPLKLMHTYGWDDISISYLLGYKNTNFARVGWVIFSGGNLDKELPNSTKLGKVVYIITLILNHLFYYFLLLLILFGIYEYLQKRNYDSLINIILIFCFFASVMIMITVGTPRYKYPMFILLLPFAANYLAAKLKIGEMNVKQK